MPQASTVELLAIHIRLYFQLRSLKECASPRRASSQLPTDIAPRIILIRIVCTQALGAHKTRGVIPRSTDCDFYIAEFRRVELIRVAPAAKKNAYMPSTPTPSRVAVRNSVRHVEAPQRKRIVALSQM